MKLAVFITCDNKYAGKAIVALKSFTFKNNVRNPTKYDMYIIGTEFTKDSYELCKKHNVKILTVNLKKDFIFLNKRPYGKQYPIECFYHFYAYKLLTDYDFIICIEPDIYTNKHLDINLNTIKFIGGSSCEQLQIYKFKCIVRDYAKIIKLYPNVKPKQKRILPGVKIYNVKNLIKIDFYSKILDLYKKSWKIGAPRCGDDSLLVLYQMVYNNIKLLPIKFNVIGKLQCPIDDVYHYHFGGSVKKYWDTSDIRKNKADIYFTNKMTNFVYENFSMDYIKTHLPTMVPKPRSRPYTPMPTRIKNTANVALTRRIHKNKIKINANNAAKTVISRRIHASTTPISTPTPLTRTTSLTNIPPIGFYYYSKGDNFGDLITPYFLKRFCDKKDYTFNLNNKVEPKIISCGSIMRLCNSKSIVYGSGIRDIDQKINKGIIKIVRGPLTRKRLLEIGCECPPVYGDPGLLLPTYYNPTGIKKRYKLGIIPHVIHYEKVKNMYARDKGICVINLKNKDIEKVINKILECGRTISSSLHGLIVSDAYNIPNKWVKYSNEINGDGTKYLDYFMSVKRKDRIPLNCMNYKKMPVNQILKQIGKVNITFDFKKLKEIMFFDENGIKPDVKNLYASLFDDKIIR